MRQHSLCNSIACATTQHNPNNGGKLQRYMSQQHKTTQATPDPLELAQGLVAAIADKKGEDIVLMDMRGHALFADYFVICSGTSDRQLKAITDAIVQAARKQFRAHVRHVEGEAQSGWVLMDMDDVIVHIFTPSQRRFYNLEGLWKEAQIILQVQ